MHIWNLARREFARCGWMAACVIGMSLMAQPSAQAQSRALLTPMTGSQSDASPAQSGYLRALRSRPTTAAVTLVNVDVSALDADTVSITLSNGTSLQVTPVRRITRSATDFSWYGTLPDGGSVTLVAQGGDITGTIKTGQNSGQTSWQLVPLSGGMHALVTVDQKKYPPEHPPGSVPPVAPGAPSPDRSGSAAPAVESSPDASVIVDVLVPYTTSARTASSNIGSLIQLAIDESNQAYANSNANVTLRLAGVMEVTGYVESDFNTALDDLTDGTLASMAAVHTRRDQLGADEVVLLINNSTSCGLAWVNSTASLAYAVVHYDCATGNYSFAHEIGHNFGARHDPQIDSTSTPYPWGHGFLNGNAWRTIMAYSDYCNGCPRIQYFSNPNVLYNGVFTGTAALNDVARVHRDRGPTIAGFRSPSPLFAATLPSSRSIQVGATATAFATIINTGGALTGCGIAPQTSIPATFTFQTTSPSNAVSGTQNTRVPIAANGSQSFVVGFKATGALTSTDVALNYGCTGVTSAAPVVGINTLKLAFSTTPVPDMITVGLTSSNDGYAHLTGPGQSGAFVIATSNIGVASTLTARAVPFSPSIPLVATVCETVPATGACKATAAATVTRVVNANETATWAAFISATSTIATDASANRLSFEFVDSGGVVRGSTSIAVTTNP